MISETSTILVGTDFSKESDRAFEKACEIARSTGGRVHLLHVVEPVDEPDSPDPDTQKFYDALIEIAKVKLEAEVAAAHAPPVEVTCAVEIGPRVETLLRVGKALEVAMIALGSQPMKDDGQPKRLGVSHRVALSSQMPVLLVP